MSQRNEREILVTSLFPTGIPRLWCPALTHFRAHGTIDRTRIAQHLQAIAPFAKGIMVPGSTGEGWDMSDGQVREVLTVMLQAAFELDLRVLIGVLRKDLEQMLAVIEGTVSWLCEETGNPTGLAAMLSRNVVGFTVCPPTGAELTDTRLHDSLASILELGHPTALYQLPQVTRNELRPHTVAALANQFANFYLFKDTSGDDRVAQSGLDLQGVFLVRGGTRASTERWLRLVGGPYDGFLLSTANCFARELAEVIELTTSDREQAAALSKRIQTAANMCFQVVQDFPAANPFTNANKIMDQVFAFGYQAIHRPAPYLADGTQLPIEFVAKAAEALDQCGLSATTRLRGTVVVRGARSPRRTRRRGLRSETWVMSWAGPFNRKTVGLR